MKKITIAIDFSKTSLKALEFAVLFSKKFGSEIEMVWVNKPDYEESVYPADKEIIKEEAENRFCKLREDYKEKEGIDLTYKIKEGKVYKEIVEHAEHNGSDMIFAGTHGVTGFEEFWMGSNAFKIVSASKLPVFTVRGDYIIDDKILQKIVLPIDRTIETRQKVPLAVKLAKKFNAEVHVLPLYSTHYENIIKKITSYVNQTADFLKTYNIKYFIEDINVEDSADATINYAKKIDADLVMIMSKLNINPFAFILGSYSRHMVNHSPIPVITVEPVETFNYTAQFIHQ
jgi:nucleotide-binding universal stress UspA family protein